MQNNPLLEEYKDLSLNMRHYANMRFAQLTLFFAFIAGLAHFLFNGEANIPCTFRMILKAVGIFGALAFGVMEKRAVAYWRRFHVRAVEIENILGFKQYKHCPTKSFLSATNASQSLIWGAALLWLFSIIFGV